MKSLAELAAIRDKAKSNVTMREEADDNKIRVVVGMATCGIAAGARPVLSAFVEEVAKRGLDNVAVVQTGCMGMCKLEPMVEVFVQGQEKVTYTIRNKTVASVTSNGVVKGRKNGKTNLTVQSVARRVTVLVIVTG